MDLAARADVVCFGTLAQRSPVSRGTVRRFLAACRPDALRILDINLRQHYFDREVIGESLLAANVLKLNVEEWPTVAELLELEGTTHDQMNELLRRYDLRLIALTRGGHGSVLHAPAGASVHPGYPPQSHGSLPAA